MKLLAVLLLASIAPAHKPIPEPQFAHRQLKPKGAWYMKVDGHAVYCYGPTRVLETEHGLQRFATFCRGNELIVPLHE